MFVSYVQVSSETLQGMHHKIEVSDRRRKKCKRLEFVFIENSKWLQQWLLSSSINE